MSIETLIASALSQVIHLSHHYDADSRAVYFLLFTIRGTRIGGFKWAVGGGELKARFIIESMRSQICDFFDSSRQNTITLVQTKSHEAYRPQEHANTIVIGSCKNKHHTNIILHCVPTMCDHICNRVHCMR